MRVLAHQRSILEAIHRSVQQLEGYISWNNTALAFGATRDSDMSHIRTAFHARVFRIQEAFVLDLISRVTSAHQELVGDIPTEVLDPPEVQALHR